MNRFLAGVPGRYMAANRATLDWMLARARLRHGLINTKLNSRTLIDYGADDAMAGPDFIYGWIQGRALEALVVHARAFAGTDPDLARRLEDAAHPLYRWLSDRLARDGHIHFCYGPGDRPVRPGGAGPVPQVREAGIFGFADIFAAKGLIAAAHRFDRPALDDHLRYLGRIVEAVDTGHFQIDERRDMSRAAAGGQPADFGPRVILLGAASLLSQLGLAHEAGFAHRLIAHVLDHHLDAATGLLANSPGRRTTNPGHAIEFAGFALAAADAADTLETLLTILRQSYRIGRHGPGIAVAAEIGAGSPDTGLFPWWTLPETIRAAALGFARTRDADCLEIWRDADRAFFTHYWRADPPIAYQSRDADGPVDIVPATPDLDPGYHAGISLLDAARIARGLG